MAELDVWKKQRAVIKTAFTRMYNYCVTPEANIDQVRARASRIDELFNQYEAIQQEIDNLTPEEHLELEDQYRSNIESAYYGIKTISYRLTRESSVAATQQSAGQANDTESSEMATAVQALLHHQTTMGTLIERFTSNVPETSTPNVQVPIQNELQLPSIQIPEFDGNLLDWMRFKDLFEALVHNKSRLSNVQKLEYLNTKLKGDALIVIKHFRPTNSNYEVAWELLKKKYNNTENVKRSFLELILDQPAMKSGAVSEVKRLYNNSNEGFNALKAVDERVAHWSDILLFNLEKKLDSNTATLWYRDKSSREVNTFQQFLDFLEKRVCELDSVHKNTNPGTIDKMHNRNQMRTHAAIAQTCPMCSQKHFLYQCSKFNELSIENRRTFVQQNNICFNCLQSNHKAIDCKRSSCKRCNRKHNTLLHLNTEQQMSHNMVDSQKNQHACSSVNVVQQQQHEYTLLPTAIVMVNDYGGHLQPCRALLDSGSQCTLITESCVQRLGLKRKYDKTKFFGIGAGASNYTKGKVDIQISNSDGTVILGALAFCLSHLTQNLPHQQIDDEKLKFFEQFKLADPTCCKPGRIDLLLGSDVFMECCLPQKQVHPSGTPTAISTIFGWVIMGKTRTTIGNQILAGHVSIDLDDQLKRFWEIEELSVQKQYLSEEEQQAERHYAQNTQRNEEGRYVVKLPFKRDDFKLGESKSHALKRLYAMERKCEGNINFKTQYTQFMNEYLTLGHMEPSSSTSNSQICILPHHAVLKPSSTTTKLRVVFDASCKSSNGYSLNDNLLVGPQVQRELFDIIINFRKYAIGITGDIEKMYRQIVVHPVDRPLQRILWRDTSDEKVKEYDLTTVTYGTASAPFLATRTLKQIAIDNSEAHPTASKAILHNFYVDDFMCCVPDVKAAINLKIEVCN